jgi:TfoX/Sxy family transcriptional regulator of competence genes
MPRDHALVDRVRAALGSTPHVEEKQMFGGTAFMVRGKMCISARPDRIMCRIDPAIHDVAVQRQGCRPVIMKGREYRGFVYVDAGGVRAKRDLERWIELALEYKGQEKASTRKGA